MRQLGGWIMETLRYRDDRARILTLKQEVERFCRRFPVPGLPETSIARQNTPQRISAGLPAS